MKKINRFVAIFLCLIMTIGLLPVVQAAQTVPTGNAADEWEEIRQIISQYYGEWTEPNYPNAVNKRMPFTALLGNGDLAVTSNGSANEKKFHISKSDFWEFNDPDTDGKDRSWGVPLVGGTISVKANETVEQKENLAPQAQNITTSDGSDGSKAVDGRQISLYDGSTGWTSTSKDPGQWLQLEFNDKITFDQWEVYSWSYTASGKSRYTTIAAELQTSTDGTDWETISSFADNAQTLCKVKLDAPVETKYVRLLVTDPAYDGASNETRIPQFCLYLNEDEAMTGPENLAPGYASVSASSEFQTYNAKQAVNGNWHNDDYQTWCTNVGNPQWLELDMGKDITFNRWVVYNDNAGRPGHSDFNTKDCELQISETGGADATDWRTVDSVTDNADDVIVRDLKESVNARYIRLYVSKGTQETTSDSKNYPRTRIGQFELYNVKEGNPEPEIPGEKPVDFREVQDILNAEIRTTQMLADVPLDFKTWLSATNNFMIMEISSKAESATGSLQIDMVAPKGTTHERTVAAEAGDGYALVSRTSCPVATDAPNSYLTKLSIAAKVIGADATYTADSAGGTAQILLDLAPGETVYVVSAICGGGRTYQPDMTLWESDRDPDDEACELLATMKDADDIKRVHQEHLDWWKDYWMASYIDLDTTNPELAAIQKYYYGAQYELGCAVRNGAVAPGLYGHWRTDTSDMPNLYSDYHLNYNFIATFYGSGSSNRVDQLLPAVDAIEDYIPTGMKKAASVTELRKIDGSYGHVDRLIKLGKVDTEAGIANAVLYPVGIGPYGMDMVPKYHRETLNAAYSAYPMIDYYRFTMDATFAKEHLMPYLKLVLNFLEAWIVEEPEDSGKYVIYAGYNEGSWAKNAAVELGGYKVCLDMAIELSHTLGIETEKCATWEAIRSGLPEQPTVKDYKSTGKTVLSMAEQDYKNGQWSPVKSPLPGDGNCLPLDSMLPGNVFGYYSSEAELEIVQNTIDAFNDIGGWTKINNFSRLFPDAVNARYDINTIINKLASTINSQLAPNLMINDTRHGVEKAGATKAINNMMLLSDKGVIKLFGNWLEDWDAKFVRLRAPGAFVFSAEYDGTDREILEGVTMYSEAGATATVASLWEEGMVVKNSMGNVVRTTEGTAPNHPEEKTYTFATRAGETYTFEKVPEAVELDRSEATMTVGDTLTLKATVLPEDAADKTVSWSSSDEAVATVAEDGTVTAVAEGKATITVTTTAGAKAASCEITVEKAHQGGGTVTTPSYTITVTQTSGGKISPSTTSVRKGSDKTFTITANDGYKISDVLVDGKSVGAVSTYTFENVTAKHTITAKFEEIGETGNIGGFIDVHTDDWFADAVQYIVDEGLMNGTSSDTFTPNGATTRGMIVTILYRQAGSPEVESDGKTWWSDARAWAVANGISDGTNMDTGITREQLATMLYRYAELKGEDISKRTSLDRFKDGNTVYGYAIEAMKWAVAEGIVTGKTGNIIDPQAGATRAETATMLMRFTSLI